MQKSTTSQPILSEDEYFESVEKEETLETINFIPVSSFREEGRRDKRNEEDIVWKMQAMESSNSAKKKHFHFSKNISFEEEDAFSSEQEAGEEEELQFSSLSSHYRLCEEVYQKKYQFGTSWIGKRQYFASTFINPNILEKASVQYFIQKQLEQTAKPYSFDSNFESGNLFSVYKTSANEFDLLLQNDINTKGNTQWFYFRINSPPKNTPIKINIVNMRKPDSLFNYGMMPCIHSLQEERKTKRGWFRGGKNIKYYRNDHQIENSRRYYYTLTFTVSTGYDNDVLRIAQAYPYTYSDLIAYLESVERIKYKQQLFERQTIQNTVGRNKIETITIKEANLKTKPRPIIIIIARQHPGETPGSFICEGLIDFLLSKDRQGEFLRKNYEIKVLPMVNPDGVCAGNYRTNLSGFDLNRRWDGSKIKNLHEAAFIKRYIAQITKGREIAFMLDLHGHSRKMFSFFYGNPHPSNPVDVRMFPLICSKLHPHCIKFEDCTFTSEDFKRNTARVQFGLSFKCINIFTFQASFFGYFGKDKEKKHFTIDDYRQLGSVLGKGIYNYERGKELYEHNQENKEIALYRKCLNELRNNMVLISIGNKANSGSQSSPQECELKENEGQKLQVSEDYSKGSPPKNVKVIKKVVKRELVKWPTRSERQMQVMDIAQVNSMLPNNILALIPNSFLIKKKKAETATKAVQTDTNTAIKIYESCKQQQQQWSNPQSSLHLKSQSNTDWKPISMVKSNILTLSRQQQSRERLFSAGFSRMTQRKCNSTKSTHKKASSYSARKGTAHKETQTMQSFSCATAKAKIDKEITILELKSIDPSFTSFNFSKSKEASFICKNSSISMFQNLKIRKRGQT